MNKSILILVSFLTIGVVILFYQTQRVKFENLSTQEMQETIISQRDIAIEKAIAAGDYKCCIKPPCTMCYMEANQWNNYKAGTCACDDLVREGKEPCPECRQGLCETSEEGTCKIN